jgi:NTP pyrophosphatase (non-canonical NTP hydrolase)
VEKLKDELGDVLWYYFILLDTIGLTFEDVMAANVAKLEQRHGNGFNPHYASDSHASEVQR